MIERLESQFERVPRQAAFDGGFASKDNRKGPTNGVFPPPTLYDMITGYA
jgi:hypothetical protein